MHVGMSHPWDKFVVLWPTSGRASRRQYGCQEGGLEARFDNTPGPKMKQAYVARLESSAQNNPTLDTLRRLAKASQCKVSELVH
jgi:hypothetical protein